MQHEQENAPIKGKQGLASMTPERRAEIARMGGHAIQQSRQAHLWTREEAQEAGRLGGRISKRGSRKKAQEPSSTPTLPA